MAKEQTEEKQIVEQSKGKEAIIKEIPTEYGLTVELPDGKQVDSLGLLVEIYNLLIRIKKSVA